jgi:LPS export ABC transporter protein LptC
MMKGVIMLLPMLASACVGDGAKPNIIVTVTDSADQVLYGFTHFVTRNGVRESEMQADTAFFYDPTQTTVLRHMRVVFIDSTGAESATVTSKHGAYLWQTGNMVAESTVVLTTHDGRVLKSERLRYDAEKQSLSTDLPFVYDNKGEHVEGQGFVSDLSFRNIAAKQPKGVTDQGTLLPGQEADSAEVP